MLNELEIEKLLCEKFKAESLDRNATIASYGIDSLEVVELIMDLEDNFGIKLNDEDFPNIKTVGDLIDIISKKANNK